MANEYYTFPENISPFTLARAEVVSASLVAIEAAFDALPAPGLIVAGTVSFASDSGGANVYVMALSPGPAAYSLGLTVDMLAGNANTGSSTVNVNGLGAKQIRDFGGAQLEAGMIPAGGIVTLRYDGTVFRLNNIVGLVIPQDGSVTAVKIAVGAVTADKLGAGAVTTAKLADGAVTAAKLGAVVFDASNLADGAVDTAALAAGAVTSVKIDAGAVTTTTLADGAVTAVKVASGAVTSDKIGAGAVTTTTLADGAVTVAKMATAAQATVIGRAAAAGTGVVSALSATSLRTIVEPAANGLLARTAAGTWASRTLAVGAGLSITNATGAAGNPSITLDLASDANTTRPVSTGGTGGTTQTEARTGLGLGSMATQAAGSVAVTGGTVNGVAIGGTTRAAGAFASVASTGAVTAASVAATGDVSGATGTFSGAVSAASAAATGDVSGATGTFSGAHSALSYAGDGSALTGISGGVTLLGTITTTSGASQSLSGLDLTPYKYVQIAVDGVSINSTAAFRLASIVVTDNLVSTGGTFHGEMNIELVGGTALGQIVEVGSSTGSVIGATSRIARTGYSTATTAIVVSVSGGNFDAGAVRVYGVS
jgi:hypothetical protein